MNTKLLLPILVVTLSLLLSSQVSVSAALVQRVTIPYDTIFPGPDPEPIHLTGVMHMMVATTTDAHDGLHSVSQIRLGGVSGIGLISGATYRASGIVQNTMNMKAPFPMEYTTALHMNIIGAGSVENLVMYMIIHLTINANGEITAEFTHMPSL